MVKVRADLPTTAAGEIDLPLWADQLVREHDQLDPERLVHAASWLAADYPDLLVEGLELAELVSDLHMDMASVLAAMVYRGVRGQLLERSELQVKVGSDATHIAANVSNMATTSLLEMSNSPLLEKEQQDQVENIKRMLVSLIQDPRVAVVKLAERVMVLRHAKNYAPQRRQRIAEEARRIFAPLAGRLGIWQLKWELEDLSLRYTDEGVYQDIARQLRGKRTEREMQVEHMTDQVRGLLRGHGIEAHVFGRAKHIYSIWRKMQSKGVSFDQVYDVRAVRVVVDTLADCYAALGVLHATWPHIPSEFDDYIANPKENGYQSIHTAVTASDGRTLEIQIRTRDMHEDAELGVCAHWSYKDGRPEEGAFAAKMDWLRQVIEWHEDLGGTARISTLLETRINEERIFISTPKGHVVELPEGATALDFAYRVHTDVGHACTGARINGATAPLNRRLETGQQVEVLTDSTAQPRRDWLEASLEYVRTDRARAKLYNHFRNLEEHQQINIGRSMLLEKLRALGIEARDERSIARMASQWNKADELALWRGVGSGELSSIDVITTWLQREPGADQLYLPGMEHVDFPQTVRFKVVADNRDGLLHDITQLIGDMNIPLTGTTARVSNVDGHAIITVDVTLYDWPQSVKFVSYLGLIEGVTEIRRHKL